MIKNAKDVFIIGAGVAGLSAAYHLARQGIKVGVIEAQSIVGGRIKTLYIGEKKYPVEMGASYWEGFSRGENKNPLFKQFFTNEPSLHQPRVHIADYFASELYLINRQTNEKIKHERFVELHTVAEELELELDHSKASLAHAIDDIITQKQTLLKEQNITLEECEIIKRLIAFFKAEQGTHAHSVGFDHIDKYYSQTHKDILEYEQYNTEMAMSTFILGYDKLPKQLHQQCVDLGVEFEFNCPVKKIKLNSNDITLVTDSKQFVCPYVISTIPEGVMKKQAHLLFEPKLSDERLEAWQSLGVHEGCRVALEFDGQFWEGCKGPYILLDDPKVDRLIEIRNLYPINGQNILSTDAYALFAKECYDKLPDNPSREEVEKTNQKIVDKIMDDLRQVFPNAPNPSHTYIHNWSADPFTRGAYPYPSPFMTPEKHRLLLEPLGRLHFAGVATSMGESIHNAFASGIRVANQVSVKALPEKIVTGMKQMTLTWQQKTHPTLAHPTLKNLQQSQLIRKRHLFTKTMHQRKFG